MSDSEKKTGKIIPNMTRRTFLKVAGVAGVTAATARNFDKVQESVYASSAATPSKFETFRSTCAMECLHCNLTAFVQDGKLIKVEASKDFNVTGCLRGISRSQWVNHPDRLKYPLKRVGSKGEGKFEQISWDEALDLIVEKIKETISKSGNQGIFLQTGSGNMDSIVNSTASAFFDFLGGCTKAKGTLCCSAVTAGMTPIVGKRYIDTRDTISDSRYILCWGNNPAVTMQAYFKEYEKAIEKGARLVVIDPRFSETAAKADEWIPINPGTDTALALGMMNVIISENLEDTEFLINHTGAPYLIDSNGDLLRENAQDADSYLVYDSIQQKIVRHNSPGIKPVLSIGEKSLPNGLRTVFDLIKKEAELWTPEKVMEETDVPVKTILRLARDYATTKPAMIIQNMSGAQRTEYGGYTVASQFYLSLITGNIGKAGTGVCDAGGAEQFIKINPPIKAPKSKKLPGIPVSEVGNCILQDKPGKIDFWWIMTTSPVTQTPNSNLVKKALCKVPFVVVADNLMTSTALFADLVLPVTTIFEDVSLMAGKRSHYAQLMEKAVEPPGEAKPDRWIFTELAKRLGFGENFDKPVEAYIGACLEGTGITLEQLKKGPIKPVPTPSIPFKNGEFLTSTKKAHFYIEDWKELKQNPVVTYIRPDESPKGSPELAKKYPLMAVQRKMVRSIHSSFSTMPWLNETLTSKPGILMHPKDAEVRGIKNGDHVVVLNDRGQHAATVEVTTHIKQGVISMENGWWEQQGGSSSHVTNDKPELLGSGQSCNSTLVDVKREG